MRVITIGNQKGGVGKTTTSVTLGGLLAAEGHRVLLVDLDPHSSLTTYFKFDPDAQPLSSYTLFQERKSLTRESVLRLVQPTQFENISIISSTTALATLERQAIGQDGMGLVLMRALNLIEADFDYVLLDTPPILGVLMVNALAACHWLVIPVQTEFLALKGLEKMVNTLRMMEKSRKKPFHYTIVPVMFDRRTQASVVTLRNIRNSYNEHTWAGYIPVDTKLRDASRLGVPAHLLDAKSRGVEAYTSLNQFLLKNLTQLEHTLEVEKSTLARGGL